MRPTGKSGKYNRENTIRVWKWLESHPCPCGETNPALLELNHLVPSNKVASIATLKKYSWAAVERELSHCETLCVSCHRLHTMGQRQFYNTPEMRSYLARWPANAAEFAKHEVTKLQRQPRIRSGKVR